MKRKEYDNHSPVGHPRTTKEYGGSSTPSAAALGGDASQQQIEVAKSGLKLCEDVTITDFGSEIYTRPDRHMCSKEQSVDIVGCDKSWIVIEWYAKLNPYARELIKNSGFAPLIGSLGNKYVDPGLMQALAERWWDTTHTFHFEGVGEMTMTPTDFSAITGLTVAGKVLAKRTESQKDDKLLIELLGPHIRDVSDTAVTGSWLWETYGNNDVGNGVECLMEVRAFILAVIGCALFSNEHNNVDLSYVYMLEDIDNIGQWNWGGAALAYQYSQMDDLCRGKRKWIGGVWQCWEVWAKEYVPWILINEPPLQTNVYPRLQRWKTHANPSYELSVLTSYYRKKFQVVQVHQIVWDPFTLDANVPSYISNSLVMSNQRVLLVGPNGGSWYLGERVRRQIAGPHDVPIPKLPPKSMLRASTNKVKNVSAAVNGQPYELFVDKQFAFTYDVYRRMLSQSLEAAKRTSMRAVDEETFAMPGWAVVVPTPNGESDLIAIPMDKQMTHCDIPDIVTSVSRAAAVKLLKMIAGLHHLLVHYIVEAKEKLSESSKEIHSLRCQLGTIKDDLKSDSTY